jgi:hypothetical protein
LFLEWQHSVREIKIASLAAINTATSQKNDDKYKILSPFKSKTSVLGSALSPKLGLRSGLGLGSLKGGFIKGGNPSSVNNDNDEKSSRNGDEFSEVNPLSSAPNR